jgi:hypothetical protein
MFKCQLAGPDARLIMPWTVGWKLFSLPRAFEKGFCSASWTPSRQMLGKVYNIWGTWAEHYRHDHDSLPFTLMLALGGWLDDGDNGRCELRQLVEAECDRSRMFTLLFHLGAGLKSESYRNSSFFIVQSSMIKLFGLFFCLQESSCRPYDILLTLKPFVLC